MTSSVVTKFCEISQWWDTSSCDRRAIGCDIRAVPASFTAQLDVPKKDPAPRQRAQYRALFSVYPLNHRFAFELRFPLIECRGL